MAPVNTTTLAVESGGTPTDVRVIARALPPTCDGPSGLCSYLIPPSRHAQVFNQAAQLFNAVQLFNPVRYHVSDTLRR